MKNTTEPNPVAERWARLIHEYPDIPRNVLKDIFSAGVAAKADEINIEFLASDFVEYRKEKSRGICARFFEGLKS